jgi:hypothetical protein
MPGATSKELLARDELFTRGIAGGLSPLLKADPVTASARPHEPEHLSRPRTRRAGGRPAFPQGAPARPQALKLAFAGLKLLGALVTLPRLAKNAARTWPGTNLLSFRTSIGGVMHELQALLREYDRARAYTDELWKDLTRTR